MALLAALSTLSIAEPALADITGPDVSSWQHPSGAGIDWTSVRSTGRPFAFVKATEDVTYTNPYFASDWSAVRAARMDRGAYHFAQPASSAVGQANYFASVVGDLREPGDLPPVLDLEVTGGLAPPQLIAWTHDFLSTVQASTGRTPMIYVSPNFWINAMADSHEFTGYPLWIARWTSATDPYPLPGGWSTWTFWQYTNAGSISGIAGNVDVSRFNGDLAALTALSLGAPLPPPGNYHPLAPTRILDTRYRNVGPPSPILAFQAVDVPVAGYAGVPANATSVVLNVTATGPGGPGFLALYPAGSARPDTSSVAYVGGETIANLVEVQLGVGGQVSVYSHAANSDVILDVQGYVSSGSGPDGLFHAVAPARIADTRAGFGGRTVGPGQSLDVQVTGSQAQGGGPSGVPAAGAEAVVLNVTATNAGAASYLTLYPTGQPGGRPFASNLDFPGGGSLANRVIVPLGAGGKVTVYNFAGNADVLIDVNGWFSDSSGSTTGGKLYHAASAIRMFDSRGGAPQHPGDTNPLQISGTAGLPAAPGPAAVVLNVTPTNTTASGYLVVFPSGVLKPGASDIDWAAGQTNPNMVVVAPGSNGLIEIHNHAGNTDIILDLVGWYG